jgi:hypothetical protein
MVYDVTIPFNVRSPNLSLPLECSDRVFTHFSFQAICSINIISPDFIALINVCHKITLLHVFRVIYVRV